LMRKDTFLEVVNEEIAAVLPQAETRIRKARISDITAIAGLVNKHADIGDVLPRSEEDLSEGIRDFFVADGDDGVLGCSSLKIMGPDLAEVRSLVVSEQAQGLGLGKALVVACVSEAKELGIARVFALTAKPVFFEKLDFRRVPRSTFPQKIWKDCFQCKFFEACGEVAVQYDFPQLP